MTDGSEWLIESDRPNLTVSLREQKGSELHDMNAPRFRRFGSHPRSGNEYFVQLLCG
jgi:hypothetical protein